MGSEMCIRDRNYTGTFTGNYVRTVSYSGGGTWTRIFIGGTLLERNFAKVTCRNSITRNGAEVIIKWNNKDLQGF